MSEEKVKNFAETSQQYLTTVLEYLTYLSDKSEAEKAQDKLDEEIEKSKRK